MSGGLAATAAEVAQARNLHPRFSLSAIRAEAGLSQKASRSHRLSSSSSSSSTLSPAPPASSFLLVASPKLVLLDTHSFTPDHNDCLQRYQRRPRRQQGTLLQPSCTAVSLLTRPLTGHLPLHLRVCRRGPSRQDLVSTPRIGPPKAACAQWLRVAGALYPE